MHAAGRVIGDVVATRKDDSLVGITLLLVQPLTPDREPAGRPLVAVGCRRRRRRRGSVLRARQGSELSRSIPAEPPVDAGIVGIVDHWDLDGLSVTDAARDGRRHRRRRRRSTGSSRARSCCSCSRSTSTTRRAARRCSRWTASAPAWTRRCWSCSKDGRRARRSAGRRAPVDAAIVGIIEVDSTSAVELSDGELRAMVREAIARLEAPASAEQGTAERERHASHARLPFGLAARVADGDEGCVPHRAVGPLQPLRLLPVVRPLSHARSSSRASCPRRSSPARIRRRGRSSR